MNRVIICVTNDLSTDQRVHKTAQSLMKHLDMDVVLVGRKKKGSPAIERPYQTHRFRMCFQKGPLFYAFYNFRLLWYLLMKRCTTILSNDLDTLPAATIAAWLRRKQLVYDSHELFTEVPELIGRPRIQNIWSWLERKCIPRVDRFYTVCEPIAAIYRAKYHKQVAVIRNVPMVREIGETAKFDQPTLIYQGALNLGRGIELMIDTMAFLPGFQLIICGKGDVESQLKARAEKQRLRNVLFKGQVDIEAIKHLTPRAHIGLSWEENLGLNYYYALPNKIFDYIQAQIPILVADLPGMHGIVEQYGVGEVIGERNAEKIAVQITRLYEKRHTFEPALIKAAEELNWQVEEKKLIDIFT